MKKIVALTIAGAAAAIVAGWRRVQRDNEIAGDRPLAAEPPAAGVPSPGATAVTGDESAAPPAGDGSGSRPEVDPGATKAELYEIARELDIEGRSGMTKAELLSAIRAAG